MPRPISWNFITSSKGGAGKTLFSLCLLNILLTSEKMATDGTILVCDINLVNRDLLKITGTQQQTLRARDRITLPSGNTLYFFDFELRKRLIVLAVFDNPFSPWTSKEFDDDFSFLRTLIVDGRVVSSSASVDVRPVSQELVANLANTTHVVFDTSQHFANLAVSLSPPEIESGHIINYWFVWVYNQLKPLEAYFARGATSTSEPVRVLPTLSTMLFNEGHHVLAAAADIETAGGRIVHVLNPYRLFDIDPTTAHPVVKAWVEYLNPDPNKTVRSVKSLAKMKKFKSAPYLAFANVSRLYLTARDEALQSTEVPLRGEGRRYLWGQLLKELSVLLEGGLSSMPRRWLGADQSFLASYPRNSIPKNIGV